MRNFVKKNTNKKYQSFSNKKVLNLNLEAPLSTCVILGELLKLSKPLFLIGKIK